jgi:hypothetical protein
LPPAYQEQTAVADHLLHNGDRPRALGSILRKKENADSDFPFRIELGIEPAGLSCKESRRELDQNAGAVTAGPVGVHTPTMREVPKTLKRLLDHTMRRCSAQLSNEAHSAGIVLFSAV